MEPDGQKEGSVGVGSSVLQEGDGEGGALLVRQGSCGHLVPVERTHRLVQLPSAGVWADLGTRRALFCRFFCLMWYVGVVGFCCCCYYCCVVVVVVVGFCVFCFICGK